MKTILDASMIETVGILVHGKVSPDFKGKGVSINAGDDIEESLFIPLETSGCSREQLLLSAVQQGAAASLWEQGIELPSGLPPGFPVFEVADCRKALHQLTKNYLMELDPTVIAVTGFGDVNLTTALIAAVLGTKVKVHAVESGGHHAVDLCASILQMASDTEVIICKAAMNTTADLAEVSGIVEPSFAVITPFPDGQLPSEQKVELAAECARIEAGMKASSVLLVDGDDISFHRNWKTDAIKCGEAEDCLFQVKMIVEQQGRTTFELTGIHMSFTLPFSKKALKPVLFTIAISVHLGMIAEDIHQALSSVHPSSLPADDEVQQMLVQKDKNRSF
ncbi:UDP-N-acetylmuramoyl-tripeptide--D-alanyl-D-alanine ligase [Evansella caseinilytica]|uniref:UDP-N-acetylmuramoyl-tripeptide--D-alanyl-D-alanine ligase n=1 Tax=Evansella caseinilytica TaxID=1503961 RepID=A0A1H3MHI0_9BACI|nr:hypothetical protein [Evansella caseinilytica]SDY76121.1 UDP-N-acetylmuramoyl-tripeptide--D-alanyl-D-alanine ligase [Evansella caseinilytica]